MNRTVAETERSGRARDVRGELLRTPAASPDGVT